MEGSSFTKFVKFLFILLAIISNTKPSLATRDLAPKPNTDFIRKSCNATIYPRLCFSSLLSHANSIQTSPKLLTATALNVTLATAKSTLALLSSLSQSHGLKPREIDAMKDCIEELSDSVYELRESIGEMCKLEGFDFQVKMNDIQTWVSAALTDEDTCTDGFEGKAMNVKVKNDVRKLIMNIAHLTSNALALINRYVSLHG
ncbi:21 kDa protein-like [Fagus crenata]